MDSTVCTLEHIAQWGGPPDAAEIAVETAAITQFAFGIHATPPPLAWCKSVDFASRRAIWGR
eukprot:1373393-Amphidinium_carterae.1